MDDPIAHPVALAELVAYQPGSVVSRVLLRNDGGVMTVFAFAPGQGLTEHTSPHEAVVLILEGEARITIADDAHEVAAGEVLHLPATIPHALQSDGGFKMLLTLLKNGPA